MRPCSRAQSKPWIAPCQEFILRARNSDVWRQKWPIWLLWVESDAKSMRFERLNQTPGGTRSGRVQDRDLRRLENHLVGHDRVVQPGGFRFRFPVFEFRVSGFGFRGQPKGGRSVLRRLALSVSQQDMSKVRRAMQQQWPPRPPRLQIWSRYARKFEPRKPSNSAEW